MNLSRIIFSVICVIALYSCADYSVYNINQSKEKQYYSSSGFALIYEDDLYKQKVIDKKINNEDIRVMHSFLKINTPIKIINPSNSKIIETKIYRKASYPKIFNSVISKKIATILELDLNNPYVEIIETKKNKTFIAKKSNIFEEEKNVVEKVPVNEIKMDDLTNKTLEVEKKILKDNSFILVINEFYYEDSANNLKKELIKKTNMNNISVKKINNKKYRLLVGPFKNFNALKTAYISLNNLGFEDLNIYKD
tara:strand:- start:250 stop:1005 length:756 start_codon:yes stop_codon:yes gene_type:complete